MDRGQHGFRKACRKIPEGMPEDPGRHAGAMPAIDGDIILKGICDTKAGRLAEGLRKAPSNASVV